jgi:hypothetical protein
MEKYMNTLKTLAIGAVAFMFSACSLFSALPGTQPAPGASINVAPVSLTAGALYAPTLAKTCTTGDVVACGLYNLNHNICQTNLIAFNGTLEGVLYQAVPALEAPGMLIMPQVNAAASAEQMKLCVAEAYLVPAPVAVKSTAK